MENTKDVLMLMSRKILNQTNNRNLGLLNEFASTIRQQYSQKLSENIKEKKYKDDSEELKAVIEVSDIFFNSLSYALEHSMSKFRKNLSKDIEDENLVNEVVKILKS